MHFLTCLVPLCAQVFCILTYPWPQQARCRRKIPVGARRRGCPPATKRKAKGEEGTTVFPPSPEIPHGGGLEGRCTSPAEGLPHHGTGEDQACLAQGRTRSPAQEHQELLQVPPGARALARCGFCVRPGEGGGRPCPAGERLCPAAQGQR